MAERIILNVEDDEGSYFVLKHLFDEICSDAELIRAVDGEQAIETIRRFAENPNLHLDLVLMDVNLPIRTGWEVLEVIRAAESYAKVPVVMFTGVTREQDRLRSMELGAEYLQKPSDLAGLTKVVRDVCDKLGLFGHSLA
jgi:DNA-binding response OmpR family regulator